MKKLLVLLVAGGLGYHFWNKQLEPVEPGLRSTGFIELAQPMGLTPNTVLVLASINRPKDGVKRADNLATQLASRNIPHIRTNAVNVEFPGSDFPNQSEEILNGEAPVVFINGRGTANPQLDEVVAQYDAARAKRN